MKILKNLTLVGILGFSPMAFGNTNTLERVNKLESEASELARLAEECGVKEIEFECVKYNLRDDQDRIVFSYYPKLGRDGFFVFREEGRFEDAFSENYLGWLRANIKKLNVVDLELMDEITRNFEERRKYARCLLTS